MAIPADINATIPGAPNFRWYEFLRSNVANNRGIDNRPTSPVVYDRIKYLAVNLLQPLRDHFGPIHINSGYRSPALTKAVGSTMRSFHAFGMAADIVPVTGQKFTTLDMFEYIYDNLPYSEMVAEEFPGGWVHVALENGRAYERQLKYKPVGGKVRRATIEEILRLAR